MSQNSEAAAYVSKCISSPDHFNASSNLIFDLLAKKSKSYTDDFVSALTVIFNDPDVSPRSKFYALYLLAKATEANNEFLMTRMAKQREMLNRLFKDCQFNDAKSVTEKGKTFFSQSPSAEESILGGNFVRLLLECFLYWNKTFGVDDNSNPLHIYQIMYNTLSERIRFPEHFLYITKTFEINEDFHYAPPTSLSNIQMARSLSGSPSKLFSPNASLANLQNLKTSQPSSPGLIESVKEQLRSCTTSGRSYKRNNYKVFDGIAGQNSKKYIADYLEATKDNLRAKESTPSQKFYSVYLLLRTTETNNKQLITELVTNRKDLLSDLYAFASADYQKDPKERGKAAFSKEPSEDDARVGRNFVILITETLIFWKKSFVAGSKDPTSVFDLIYSKLEAKKLVVKEFYYVGKNLDTDGENYATRFEATAPQNFPKSDLKSPGTSPPKVIKEQPSSLSPSPEKKSKAVESPAIQTKSKQPEVTPSKFEENFTTVESIQNPNKSKNTVTANEQQSPEVAQAKQALAQLEHNKTALRQFLENNKQENDMKDFVGYLYQEIPNTYEKSVLPNVDPLIANTNPSSEKYVTQIFAEGEVVENLKKYYSRYQKGQLPYKDFRTRVVPLLRPREDPSEEKPLATPTETSELTKQSQPQAQAQEKVKKAAAPPAENTTSNKPAKLENIEPLKTDVALGKPPRSLLSPTAEFANTITSSKNSQKPKSTDISETDPNKTKFTKPIHYLMSPSPVRREEGDTLEGENKLKNSSFKLHSLRTTPGRNGAFDGEDTRQSLKLSRVRSTDLSLIENSIRHSFVSSGRKPPEFKPLTEFQVKEEYEKEIGKLKLERDAQQKEITALKQTLAEQKHQINSLQEQVQTLAQENTELKSGENNAKLQQKIKELETQLEIYSYNEPKKIINIASSQSGSGLGHQRGRSIDSQSRKLGPGPIEEDDEERYATPTNEYSISQAPYDANWANTQPGASVESSMYDVEWPATAQQGKSLVSELEARQTQNTKETMIRGREIETTHQIYTDLKNTKDLKTFKLACLKTKCPLYENNLLRVGISTNIVHDASSNKNMLKMVLYYENKSNSRIESFVAEVVQGKNTNRFAKPNPLEGPLDQGKQTKQQVVATYEKVPFECLKLLLRVNSEIYEVSLPTIITKFAEFKLTATDAFRQKWKTSSQNVIKTQELVIDSNIIKTAFDFKKFFPHLVDLNPMNEYEYLQGTKSIKLGGIFEIDAPGQEYLLKINILPTQKVVFQIAVPDTDASLATFFLQSLAFLFKKP